jgi:cation-transporting ATPase 13A1
VFARHAPREKEAVVAALNACGKFTLMCGDGTNDVGALKQAHVGISLISVPAIEKKKRQASEKVKQLHKEEKREKKTGTSAGSQEVAAAKKKSRDTSMRKYLKELKDADDELEYVSLGDASVASPFTSRGTSIAGPASRAASESFCKDVVRWLRCSRSTKF